MSMPSVLTEAVGAAPPRRANQSPTTTPKSHVLEQIAEHVLLDGFRIVIDLEKSKGSYLYDAAHD
ncbi:MAG: hypothetical protein ACR2MW_06805, partial [Chthoniobacterales bacterium]